MDDAEKKAEELLDGDEAKDREKGKRKTKGAKEEPVTDPMEQLRQLCRGKLKLMTPIRGGGKDVTELEFDFCALTGTEMMDALDSVPANNMFAISNQQAVALFAATAAKGSKELDARDIRERIGAVDAVKAVQLAKLFYNASSQAGNSNISRG